MLYLKRVIHPQDILKCDLSDDYIIYGDYYYEDDVDGKIIKLEEYNKRKRERREAEFDYTLLNQAQSQAEYTETLKRIEREILEDNLLDRPIFDQGHAKKHGME